MDVSVNSQFLSIAAPILCLYIGAVFWSKSHAIHVPPRFVWTLLFAALCEPLLLADAVWCLYRFSQVQPALMLKSQSYLTAAIVIWLITTAVTGWLCLKFYHRPSASMHRFLIYSLIIGFASAVLLFMEAPKMIWSNIPVSQFSEFQVVVWYSAALNALAALDCYLHRRELAK